MEANMARKRKQYTGEEKLAILRKHLLEGVAVSDICDEHDLQPTVFYRWQKQLFEEGAMVFRRPNDPEAKQLQQQVTHLEERLEKKNEVLGELLEEYVALKKELGAL
jgi:transposase-like protein